MPTTSTGASSLKPTVNSTPVVATAAAELTPLPKQGLAKLSTGPTRKRTIATTIRLWHTRNRELLERVAAGLRQLDYPAARTSTGPVRGRAHAIHLMADHAAHKCPRFQLATQFIEGSQ
ncbi:hypothetical protein [Nocardia cyriacigeorgica]|uniref:hypothetical protein n=1 Tax=Nocardia cyriacigeorgica TaxID=135487 RepID=UPI001893E3A5|nr:hypothetical protein [Nocardia cyriacigeorgica]MBF6416116.1 hypothetical protein [Nocardia cyriacigeorgica]